MLSFYPGPSKVYPEVLGFIQEAFEEGMVSINHRSPRFEQLLKSTLDSLHDKWNIPSDYTIYFISSATEAWEIVSQSLVEHKSMHLYNGAFGKMGPLCLPNTSRIGFACVRFASKPFRYFRTH